MLVARLGRSWGVKGYLKVFSESGETQHFQSLSSVFVGRALNSLKEYAVQDVVLHSHRVLIKFRGVETPEVAKALSGFFVWVSRAHATPLGVGEYYVSDLVGLVVVSIFREELGVVRAILYGARTPLLEVLRGDGSFFLVPLEDPFVKEISGAKEVVINKELVL